jgi:hypothetical protein
MALQLTPRTNGIPDTDARLKQVKVVVCTETCTFSGYAYCASNQRLLDALNLNAVANSMPLGKEFLPLTQVELSLPNGEKKNTPETYIKKSSILFIGEISENQSSVSPDKVRPLFYPMRPKNPLAAEIHLPLYVLRGQMYGEAWQQILDVVDRADKFIALTNVQAYRTSDGATSTFDFVAVNRDKIIFVGDPITANESSLPVN